MTKIDPVEQHLLLDAIFLRYGYDFRQYAEASLERRLGSVLGSFGFDDPLDLMKRILRDRAFFLRVLSSFTVTTTEFFRDPQSFRILRDRVVSILKTYPAINIWVAGCSSGEEVVSLAILLREEGLDKRTTIYATDINSLALKRAREGIYDLAQVQTFTKNYVAYGGRKSPSEYYTADYGFAKFDQTLMENVVFTEHNLVTDGVFLEAQLIMCRNVMMYFSRELQDRVLGLFTDSLVPRGFLSVGDKETLRFSSVAPYFEEVENNTRIYQLVAGKERKQGSETGFSNSRLSLKRDLILEKDSEGGNSDG